MSGRAAVMDCEQRVDLTDEQMRIIDLVARGLTDQSIADRLALSVPTVQRRLHAAAHQLGVDSRVTLVVRAIARGLIDAGAIDADLGNRDTTNGQKS